MNLLVTNTRNSQAYSVIRALRPYASKIVVTIFGKNPLVAGLSHAANSRLVDKRYRVPSPMEDWRAGRIERENTDNEERYIQAVLSICERENIDTIFPSFDPQVYVLSKNKARFEERGILITVPDYDSVVIALDKYRTILAAQKSGFPCPKTFLPDDKAGLPSIADQLGFPLVLKHRFTAAGRGFEMARDWPDLMEKLQRLNGRNTYMLQEYIPGKEQQNMYLSLDREGTLKMAVRNEQIRSFYRLHINFPVVSRALDPKPYLGQLATLARQIGWWGGLAMQMKLDPRDGLPKLMEINPRIGEGRWALVASGLNEPLLCLQIARGKPVEPLKAWAPGTLFVCPVEDLLSFWIKLLDLMVYRILSFLGRHYQPDPFNAPMAMRNLLASYMQTYLGSHPRVYNLYFRHLLSDPLASLTWWMQTMTAVWRALKEIGR